MCVVLNVKRMGICGWNLKLDLLLNLFGWCFKLRVILSGEREVCWVIGVFKG